MILRKVKEKDIDLLYRWANDSLVRQNSFNSKKIDYEDHREWFRNKLKSNNSYIYILEEVKPIGQIRIDIEDDVGIINYSIDKKFRGNGCGTRLLKLIIDKLENNNIGIKKLVGKVKYKNKASCNAFRKAGYNKEKKEDYIKYYNLL